MLPLCLGLKPFAASEADIMADIESEFFGCGEAGKRQVKNPKVGLTENGGGMVRAEAAAVSIHVLGI